MQNFSDFDSFRDSFPDYARDVKINLGSVLTEEGAPGLSEVQIHGIALACAYCVKNKSLINALETKSEHLLTQESLRAARAAAALMAMNNVYYRFTHLVNNDALKSLPAKLRMTFIGNPGIDKIDFELMSLAVSSINGCGMCMESHARHLLENGLQAVAVQSCARIAAVISSAAQVLEIES